MRVAVLGLGEAGSIYAADLPARWASVVGTDLHDIAAPSDVGLAADVAQAKLLRILQDGEFERIGSPRTIRVDVRMIAATNRNLIDEVKAELNAHAFDHATQGGSEFQTLQQRIHTMLFAERIKTGKAVTHG